MGADGGLMWLRLHEGRTVEELREHVWFFWQVENTSCYAYKGEFSNLEDVEGWSPKGGPWVEGGYGTDCEFDFAWLSSFVDYCEDDEWIVHGEDPRDLTFRELEESLLTDPHFKLWDWSAYRLGWGSYEPWWNQRLWALITDALVAKLQREIPRESDGFLHSEWKARYVPERFWDMTVREWGKQLGRIIVPNSEFCEETWT